MGLPLPPPPGPPPAGPPPDIALDIGGTLMLTGNPFTSPGRPQSAPYIFTFRKTRAPLFKYLEPRFADRLAAGESVKLGTLAEYRRLAEKDAERGDADEGKRVVIFRPSVDTYFDRTTLPEYARASIRLEGRRLLRMRPGSELVVHETALNCFLYCVSEQHDLDMLARFGGAAVRINNPEGFFRAIDACLQAMPQPAGSGATGPIVFPGVVDQCRYGDRTIVYDGSPLLEPYFQKLTDHNHQHEVRGVWAPRSDLLVIPPFQCPDVARYCERIV